MKVLAVSLMILSGFLLGWGNSGVPSCDDEYVKKEVNAMATEYFIDKVLIPKVLTSGGYYSVTSYPTYKELVSKKDNDSEEGTLARKVLEAVNQIMADTTIALKYPRINERFDDIKKVECRGSILFSRAEAVEIPVTYTVQYSDDSNMYIEIYGLGQLFAPAY